MEIRPHVVHEPDAPREAWDDPVRGRLSFRDVFSAHLTPTHALTTGIAYLEPGEWLARHRHTPPEVYFVVDGAAVVFLDGVEHVVRPGSSVFVPGDVEHGIHNPYDAPMRFHYVFPVDSWDSVEYRF